MEKEEKGGEGKWGSLSKIFASGASTRKGVDPKRLIKEAKAIGYIGFEMAPREWWDEIKAEGLK